MFLSGPGFDRKSWLNDLHSTLVENPPEDGIRLSELCHQVQELENALDLEELWLHPVGGIRGVTVRHENEQVTLSLPVGASGTDFSLAWDLMRMGVKHGASASDEEQETLDFSDEQIREITNRQSGFQWSVLLETAKKGETTLPVGGFIQIKLDAADAAAGAEALESNLVERMLRYSNVFVPRLMGIRNHQDGSVRKLSNYGHMASLIDAEAELISTMGEGGMICQDPLPASHFYSVLGDRVENLGGFYYVPAIDFKAEPELAAALQSSPVVPPLPKPAVAGNEGLTGEDWAKLAKAPCLVFFLVASADGSIDKKEMILFGTILQKHAAIPSPVFSKIIKIAQANIEALMTEIMNAEVPVPQQLLEIASLLQSGKIPREEAIVIAQCLCALGKAVASASGGFLGFGSKISRKESEVLDLLEKLFLSSAMGNGPT